MSEAHGILVSVVGTVSMLFQVFNVAMPSGVRGAFQARMIQCFEGNAVDIPFEDLPDFISDVVFDRDLHESFLSSILLFHSVRRRIQFALKHIAHQIGPAADTVESVRFQVQRMFLRLVDNSDAQLPVLDQPTHIVSGTASLTAIEDYMARHIRNAVVIVQKASMSLSFVCSNLCVRVLEINMF
jgi:hypothetical protein